MCVVELKRMSQDPIDPGSPSLPRDSCSLAQPRLVQHEANCVGRQARPQLYVTRCVTTSTRGCGNQQGQASSWGVENKSTYVADTRVEDLDEGTARLELVGLNDGDLLDLEAGGVVRDGGALGLGDGLVSDLGHCGRLVGLGKVGKGKRVLVLWKLGS